MSNINERIEVTDLTCPCGTELLREIERAVGVWDHCRIDAHKKVRKRPRKPDFTDEPLPGQDWGVA